MEIPDIFKRRALRRPSNQPGKEADMSQPRDWDPEDGFDPEGDAVEAAVEAGQLGLATQRPTAVPTDEDIVDLDPEEDRSR